jgi:predicted HNH restriction endonuclease
LAGSPIATIALLIGRAVSGVYAKVMNFRSIDPGAAGQGMSGAGETDRKVWNEFYDASTSTLRVEALSREFKRLWPEAEINISETIEASTASAMVADEASRLERQSLYNLLTKYEAQSSQRPIRPTTRILSARDYDRDPLVIAIARKRAGHRCEVNGCAHPTFETFEGIPYTEVHHIIPLADGGPDTIENVVCICAAHHREVHSGVRAVELTDQLRALRSSEARASATGRGDVVPTRNFRSGEEASLRSSSGRHRNLGTPERN